MKNATTARSPSKPFATDPLLQFAVSRVDALNSLSEGNPNDELIVMRLARNLDGRYELTAAGAAMRAGLLEIIEGAASPAAAADALHTMRSDLEAIRDGRQVPGTRSFLLEHMMLCRRVDARDSLTPHGEWLLDEFCSAEAAHTSPAARAPLLTHAI
jgi:hypothetical protein